MLVFFGLKLIYSISVFLLEIEKWSLTFESHCIFLFIPTTATTTATTNKNNVNFVLFM